MSRGPRFKDAQWICSDPGVPTVRTVEHAILATLMDLRDELKLLNGLLHCPNFTSIPIRLAAIERNTHKRRRKKKVVP